MGRHYPKHLSLVGPNQHRSCAGILQQEQCFELTAHFDARLEGPLLHFFVDRKFYPPDMLLFEIP